MNLRGSDRMRVLLMGAAAAGFFGPQHLALAENRFPIPFVKKTVPKPQPALIQPPALLPVATDVLPVSSPSFILPVAQVQAPTGKSEIQRQLELLYEADGREMPDMNMSIQPVPLPGAPEATAKPATKSATSPTNTNAGGGLRTQLPTTSAPTVQPPAQLPLAQSAPATPPPATTTKRSVATFFRKLMPGNKEKPTKAPADYRPDVAPQPPNSNPIAQSYRTPERGPVDSTPPPLKATTTPIPNGTPVGNQIALNSSVMPVKPVSSNSSLPLLDSQPRMPFVPSIANTISTSDFPPAPSGGGALPELSGTSLPPLISTALPPLPATSESRPAAGLVATAAPQQDQLPDGPAEMPTRSDLANPFTEMSEAEADKKLEPFTGLTLEESTSTASAKPAAAPRPNASKEAVAAKPVVDAEDPFAEELRQLGVLPPDPGIPVQASTAPPAQTPAKQPVLAAPERSDTPTFDGIEDQTTREKMKRIHERGSMKGLKGFCPVTLRDRRELVDAKPDFHSTYRGQKFHFADADSKLKFDEDPSRYAPAAYGADVVALTRDKDVVEGTLDFAAWFKGRLYLFGTEETHDTFVANPAQFATPVGIE